VEEGVVSHLTAVNANDLCAGCGKVLWEWEVEVDRRFCANCLRDSAATEGPPPGEDTVGTRSVSTPTGSGETGTVSPCPYVVGTGSRTQSVPDGLQSLQFEDAETFSQEDEPGADAIVGEAENILISEDGDVMFYGDGGAGKTTLANDLAVHLAAGEDWLGIPVPRPVRVGLVENEGPRPLFRLKLRRNLAAWSGAPLEGRLRMLKSPWGKVALDDPDVREGLAAQIQAQELDVLVIGPITRSGMNEAGTLQQVRDFVALFAEVRVLADRRVTFVLIHHENRAGAPSGAWEGAVDTLLHVQAQGNGQTRLHVQKARWGGKYHKQTLQLAWADGEAFEVIEDDERDDNAVADEILAFVLENAGTGWVKVEKAVKGNSDRLRSIRDNLLAGGRLVDAGTGVKGTPMKLWHADDPALDAEDEA
jgi:AAA domain